MEKEEINALHLDKQSEDKTKFDFDYSMFNREGFELDNELLEKFQEIVKKLNLSDESLKMLMEIALEMSIKQKNMYEKDKEEKQKDDIAKYCEMFKEDSELPDLNSSKAKEYMQIANDAYSFFVSDELMQLFNSTGLNYHPELIKMFYKIGELMKEDNLSYNAKPSFKDLTPAEILYGQKD